jgi:hypothetical protein
MGLTRLFGLDRTDSIKLREDGTNTGTHVGWSRRNDIKTGR